MRQILTILIATSLLYACQRTTENADIKEDAKNQVTSNELTTTRIKIESSKAYKRKNIAEIIEFIDNEYDLTESNSIDTISEWNVSKNIKYELGPKGLDLSGLAEYIQYVSFEFLVFKDSVSAKKQFERVIKTATTRPETLNEEHLYMVLFSKAGSTYVLYDNMIIYHHRRCSYNEKIEIPREDRLLDFIFNNKLPVENYFVRVRCGWSNQEIR